MSLFFFFFSKPTNAGKMTLLALSLKARMIVLLSSNKARTNVYSAKIADKADFAIGKAVQITDED